MTDYIKRLIEKYGAEECAGNIIAKIDGKRQIIAKRTDDGYVYTEAGKALQGEEDAAEVTPPVYVRRRGRPPKRGIILTETDNGV